MQMRQVLAVVLVAVSGLSTMGCAAMTGLAQGSSAVQSQQIRYCGPDGKANAEKDNAKGVNYDRLCGRCCITFKPAGKETYPATSVSEVKVYKNINHYVGDPEIRFDEQPTRPYVVIGTLKFPTRWYYSSTIDEYLKERLSAVGGHAVLSYTSYQTNALTQGDLNAYRMRMDAVVIRYTDE